MTDESIFAAALAIDSPGERAAYLDRACAGNPTLRAEVEGLLAAHAASNPLDRPPADLARTGDYEPADGPPAAAVGDRVGPYRLMEQIGEGGFGLVFVAEQEEPVRRKVALKVLKPGMDTRDVVARFEAERQALALMDHPHIAKVLDAGSTPQGRPFFVMELVRGVPITEFCDRQKLPPRDRLALFAQVCRAVQHAHQKGVIHRDIKPSNVLVASHDGVPVPKVIDFGVAKAVGQRLTDKTVYTRFAQMIGTPLYMSPEQAELSGLDVDTRADVYALGVLLYELLTGTTPFESARFRRAAFDEIRRIIREEEPPRPSARLTALGGTLTAVSASRGTDPGRLTGLVRGELDWITMKALEKDRNRRYESAAGLAKEVERYLAGEAVEACPPTLGYQLRKAYRRNRAAVVAGSAVFAALVVGLAGTLWQAERAARQAERAEGEAERVREEQTKTQAALAAAEANRQKAEVALCRSFLRPIGFETGRGRFDPAELQAFRDASAVGGDLRLLTLREALADPPTALRAARRAERFVQATVGASPVRRRAALALVGPIQNDPKADPNVRLLATWVAIELHSPDWGGFAEGVSHLARLSSRPGHGIDWHNFLTPTLLARLDAGRAAVVADTLLPPALSPNGFPGFPFSHAEPALKLVAPKLDTEAATRVAEKLVFEGGRNFAAQRSTVVELVQPLVANFRAARVDPLIRRTLTAVKPLQSDGWGEATRLESDCVILAAFAPRASDDARREVLDALLAVVEARDQKEKRPGPWYSRGLLQALVACRPAAADAQVARMIAFSGALLKLKESYAREKYFSEFVALVDGLADRMGDAQRWDTARALLDARDDLPLGSGPGLAARLLRPLARSYSLRDEAVMWRQTVDLVVLGMIHPDGSLFTQPADPAEAAWLSAAIPPGVASRVAAEYVETYTAAKPDDRNRHWLSGAERLAPKVEPATARALAQKLLDGLTAVFPRYRQQEVCEALLAFLSRLPADEARAVRGRAFDVVFGRMAEQKPDERSWYTGALVALVEAMDPGEREPYRAKLVGRLMEGADPAARSGAGRPDELAQHHLVTALPQLTPEEARRAGELLLAAARAEPGGALDKLVPCVPHADRDLTVKMLGLFCNTLKGRGDYSTRIKCLKGVVACATRLDPEANDTPLRDAYAAVASRSGPGTDTRRLDEESNALLVLAARMKPASGGPRLAELLRDHLERASLATSDVDWESAGRVSAHLSDVAALEAALDHPTAVGPHRAAILTRLEALRHPAAGAEAVGRFVRDNPAAAAVLGPAAVPAPPCRYRTAWEYFR
jgi:serine/threonine protein kinase